MQRLASLLQDTAFALGVNLYEASQALYKVMLITSEISGVADTLKELGRRVLRNSSGTGTGSPRLRPR